MKTLLPVLAALLAVSQASAQTPKSAGSGGENLTEYKKAYDDFAAYARQLSMKPPVKLLPESEFAGSAGGKGEWTSVTTFRKEYQLYQKTYTECVTLQTCEDDPPSDEALTLAKFKAALNAADDNGENLDKAGKWLCGLADASMGYFGFYPSEKRKYGYYALHNSPVASFDFSVMPLSAYAHMFNELVGTQLKCDVEGGCWIKKDCQKNVEAALEIVKKTREEHKKRSEKPKERETQVVEWDRKPPKRDRPYQYWLAQYGEAAFFDWLWPQEQLVNWYDCRAGEKHWFQMEMVRYVEPNGGKITYYKHPNRKSGSIDAEACKRFKKWRREAQKGGAKYLPI